jgi:lysine/ornithine N-monooxygenase
MTEAQLKTIADEIVDQVRVEYPEANEEEAVWDMCDAVILAEGLSKSEASLLKSLCGF